MPLYNLSDELRPISDTVRASDPAGKKFPKMKSTGRRLATIGQENRAVDKFRQQAQMKKVSNPSTIQNIIDTQPSLNPTKLSTLAKNPVYTNVKGGMHVGDNPSLVERTSGLAKLRQGKMTLSNGLEVSNSSWTPEEAARFARTPVHGGARARSGPEFARRPASGWSPDYGLSTIGQKAVMPRFTAPGFKGKARSARIHSQQQQWLKRQEKFQDAMTLAKLAQAGQNFRARSTNEYGLKSIGLRGQNQLANTVLSGQNQLTNTKLRGQNQLDNTILSGQNQLATAKLRGQNQLANTKALNEGYLKRLGITQSGKGALTQGQAAQELQKIHTRYANDQLAYVNGVKIPESEWIKSQGKEFNNFYNTLNTALDPASAAFASLVE